MQNAQLHNQGRIYDYGTSGVQTSFGPNAHPAVNDPGFHAKWQMNPHIRHPFSTRDNTSLRKALTFVIQTAARETVTIAPDNPWLGRLAPSVRTDELTIKKDILEVVRSIAPYGPHFGPGRKQRVRQSTRVRQQTRKTWGMAIEKTQLFSAEGNNILAALIRGVRETVAGTLIYEAQMEFLQSGEEYREENYHFGKNPYQNIHGMQGVAQENAMLGFYQIRRDMYGALSKSGDQFRAVLDRVIDVLRKRNAQPDALIVGPGIKARLTLGDRNNTQYYIAGDAGTFLRVNGSGSIDTYLGLDIIETLPVNPDEEIRSTFSREVEVGEYALLTRSPNSSGTDFRPYHRSKQIYSETTDSMKTITLAQVVQHAPDFDENGELVREIHDLANEYNQGSLSYKRIHGLTAATKIKPSQLSLFIYEDNNAMAQVAAVWGQIEGLGGADGIERLVQSILGGSGMSEEQFAQYSQGIDTGLALAERIKSVRLGADSFRTALYVGDELRKTKRGENNAIIDAEGNQFGGVTPTGDNPSLLGQANGAGMQTLAQLGFDEARAFVDAVNGVIRYSRRALDINPNNVTPAWFHKPNPTSAFIDILLGAQLPIWLAQPTSGDGAPAQPRIPNFTNVADGSNLDAVEAALNAPGIVFTNATQDAVARVQNSLLRVVTDGNDADKRRAVEALQRIAALTLRGQDTIGGLGAISVLSALIFLEKGVDQVANFYGLISHMLAVDDLSPAAYMAVNWTQAKKSAERLKRIAAHIAGMSNQDAQAYIQAGVAALGDDEALSAWYKQTPKISQAKQILDEHDYQTLTRADVQAPDRNFVRTPLTVSKTQLQRILSTPTLLASANFKVSHPDAPWVYVANEAAANGVSASNPFRVGGLGIGSDLEMHEQTFFANLFEPVNASLDEGRTNYARKRGRMFDSDDEDDYGYNTARPTKARDPFEISLVPERSDARGMDLAGSSSSSFQSSSTIGARFAGTRRTRNDYEGLQALGMGRDYNQMASSSMELNYAATSRLSSVIEQTLARIILFMPINKRTALNLAEAADAPFGGFIARPHIRHLMSTAMVVESGPSTALTHYTETDISSVATNSKEWIFNLTWQSTPFVHAPQFTEIFHDACALGYVGGNDTTFFKKYGPDARIYDHEFGAQASIYAFLVGAYDELPNPTSLTGVHHITGYDNNSGSGSIPVPHYRGAPLAEKIWGFSKLAKQVTNVGFVDSLANTLVFRGLTYTHTGSQINNDFVVEYENSGHWGRVKPNEGLAQVRKGSAMLQQ